MTRRIIIEGSAVYELDEDCMLQKEQEKKEDVRRTENSKEEKKTQ